MIEVKVEAALKQEVEEIFQKLGLSRDQAIQLFYKQVSQLKKLPFEVEIHAKMPNIEIPNAETQQAIDDARAHKLFPLCLEDIDFP